MLDIGCTGTLNNWITILVSNDYEILMPRNLFKLPSRFDILGTWVDEK